MKSLINKTLKLFLKSRYGNLQQAIERPFQTQSQLLMDMVDAATYTEWGRLYGFSEIDSIEDFQRNLPLSDYDDLKPYIQKMMHGERDVLWPGRVQWFSKSSGTTNDQSKFLPVTTENFDTCHKKGSWDTLAIMYQNNPDVQLFEKKSLILGGSLSHFKPHPETIIGDVSAIMIANMPLIGRPFYMPDVKVAIMEDWEQKLELTAESTIQDKEIVSIGGVPTWNLVLFRKILEKTGAEHMLQVWPKLRTYIHGGVNFEPYRSQFQTLIPREDFIFQEVYNASEGYFGTQYRPEEKDLLLLLDNGVFYEFIPLEDLDSPQPRLLTLEDVVVGEKYALVITTNSGLWRYQIGDTIEITHDRPYTFKIVGRTKQFINAFGEEVMVHNTDAAISAACSMMNCTIKDYTVAPKYLNEREMGRHDWLIEFDQAPVNMAMFTTRLDKELQAVNSDYMAKRGGNLALEELQIHVLPQGAFEAWLKFKKRQGAQVKVPRLSNNRKYVDDILQFVEQYQAHG